MSNILSLEDLAKILIEAEVKAEVEGAMSEIRTKLNLPDLTEEEATALLVVHKEMKENATTLPEIQTAIRRVREAGKPKPKARSLIAEGLNQEDTSRDIQSLFRETAMASNEHLTKFSLFFGIEGKPSDNCPQFVCRYIRPQATGYAEQLSFTQQSNKPRDYVIKELRTCDIETAMKNIEEFLVWIVKRWENLPEPGRGPVTSDKRRVKLDSGSAPF